jgi:hypothetical protein
VVNLSGVKRLAWLVTTVLLAACGTIPTPTGGSSGPTSSPHVSAHSATTSVTPSDWGPLAVASSEEASQVRMDGTVHVTDQCVLLEVQGEEVLLAWPAARTSWDPATRNITFTNRDGIRQIFSDTNRLMFQGTSSSAENGQTNEAWAASLEWASPPAGKCLRDVRLFVDEVQIPQ